ncbi:Sodium/glucose cotransporter [uncultured bacterium]|nr:Sodium/glucose cotransporter [uncultured bacterium]
MVSFIDYLIIALFLVAIAAIGILSGGKQRSVKDYFLGADNVPWWAVCFSIVAAETSTLTFISIPGLAYLTNLGFLQLTVGYLIGRIIAAYFLLPEYFKGDLSTAYAFLETRFGKKTRSFSSIVFIFTRVAADGVRLFATAIPIKLMLDISYPEAIIIIAIISFLYTFTGGVKGVIWVDAVQMFVYIGGALISIFFVWDMLPADWFESAWNAGKFTMINLGFENGIAGFFQQPYTLIGGIVGGAFLSMASHGTDQLVVQRLLAVKSLKNSQRALIGTGIVVIVQFAVFLFLGVLFYAMHQGIVPGLKSDEIFPLFILQNLPEGVKGFIIAGLLAAALSTLAGSMSSLSSSAMMDLLLPAFGNRLDQAKQLKYSRYMTVFWAGILVLSATFFMNSSRAVVEIALSIASFTYGGLLGTFLLGIMNKKATQEDALAGFVAGIGIMITVISLKLTAWPWFTIIGVIATVGVGSLLSLLSGKKEA